MTHPRFPSERLVAPENLPALPTESMRPPDEVVDLNRITFQLRSTAEPPNSEAEAAASPLVVADTRSPFRLGARIGSGGFSEVFEATQIPLKRTVAVKRRKPGAGSTGSSGSLPISEQALFTREALVAAQLDHPNIVPVYDLSFDETGEPLLALKRLAGRTWDAILTEERSLPVEERLARNLPILLTVARAVEFAHSRGILHRDLKPSQVQVGEFGEVYLMDWGLAVALPGFKSPAGIPMSEIALPISKAPSPAGTPAYMAPEQTTAETDSIGPWTDVFLLGGILYNILIGEPPHSDSGTFEAFQRAAFGECRHVRERLDKAVAEGVVREEVANLGLAALAPRRSDRIPSVATFAAEVEALIAGRQARERSIRLTEEAREIRQQNGGTYESLEQAGRRLQEALALWPANEEAVAFLGDVTQHFAAAALGAEDLGMARIQAERIHGATERRIMLDRVAAAVRTAERRRRIRRVAALSAFLMVAVAGLIGAAYTYSRSSAQQYETRMKAEEAQRLQRIEAAREMQAREEARRALESDVLDYRAAVRTLVLHPERDHFILTSPRPESNFFTAYLAANPAVHAELKALVADIFERRADLDRRGAALEPLEAAALFYAGLIRLEDETLGTCAEAAGLFREAAADRLYTVRARSGEAVAAVRLGDFERAASAVVAARIAAAALSEVQSQFPRAGHAEVLEIIAAAYPPDPGTTVVVSGDAARVQRAGLWSKLEIVVPYNAAIPRHLGLPDFEHDYTDIHWPGSPRPTESPTSLTFSAPEGTFEVYFSHGDEANISPVHVTIRHADGTSTLALSLDAFAYLGTPTSNSWHHLGRFRFTGNPAQGTTFAIGEDATPIALQRPGRFRIDGVAYAPRLMDPSPLVRPANPIPVATDGPVPGAFEGRANVQFVEPAAEAFAAARERGQAVLFLGYYPAPGDRVHPLSQSRDYFLNRILPHPFVQEVCSGTVVRTRADLSLQPELAGQYRLPHDRTSLVLFGPDGGEILRWSIGMVLPPSPAEVATRLRDALRTD